MSQHDLTVGNDTFPNVRTDLNAALQALGSNQSGGSAPGTTFAYMWWADTTNGILKRRNAANSGWVIGDTLAESYVSAKSSNYTAVVADHQRVFSCTSSFTLALTAAATLGDGWAIYVRNAGTGVITINPDASEQIDGATTVKLYPGEACIVACSGSAFTTIGRSTGWVLLDSQSASSSAQIDITQGLDDTFDRFMVDFSAVKPATDNTNLMLRIGTGGGPTYATTGYSWGWRTTSKSGGADVGSNTYGTGAIIFGPADTGTSQGVGNATGEHIAGVVELANPDATDFPIFKVRTVQLNANGLMVAADGGAMYDTAGAITALRFLFSSGNIASGTFRLYGLRKP